MEYICITRFLLTLKSLKGLALFAFSILILSERCEVENITNNPKRSFLHGDKYIINVPSHKKEILLKIRQRK